MSEYTTQLRYICEQYAGRAESADYKETPAVIAAALPKLFDFDFPLYDNSYRKALETKIVNHYYFREIGAETAAHFKFMLSRTLNEIMPYYNQLYKAADHDFNPFYDVDYYKDHKGSDEEKRLKNESGINSQHETSNGTSNNNSVFSGNFETATNGEQETTLNTQDQTTYNSTDTKTLNTTDTKTLNRKDTVRNSDTPQGAITGLENNNYLSSATITDQTGTEALARTGTETGKKTGTDTTARTGTDTTTKEETQTGTQESTTTDSGATSGTTDRTGNNSTSGTENINGTDQYLDHVYGKMGSVSYSALFTEYREALINIDMMIINELEVCFMNLY